MGRESIGSADPGRTRRDDEESEKRKTDGRPAGVAVYAAWFVAAVLVIDLVVSVLAASRFEGAQQRGVAVHVFVNGLMGPFGHQFHRVEDRTVAAFLSLCFLLIPAAILASVWRRLSPLLMGLVVFWLASGWVMACS